VLCVKPLSLARIPSPIERLARLSVEVGVELWIKRDDLTGFGTSGNKVRKLEWLVADAVARGADTLITCGGLQSNHARTTAVVARRLGLRPVLLLRHPASGAPEGPPDGNLLLDVLLGAEVHWCSPAEYAAERSDRMKAIAAALRRQGHTPYIIPEGGSNGLGARGFIAAAEELRAQDSGFDTVVVAVGSGGTLAGLVLGEAATHVRGFAVCDDAPTFEQKVAAIADELSLALPSLGDAWSVTDAWRGAAYGAASPEVWQTIRHVARTEGLLLDPTYTGKAFHGMLSEARAGGLGRRVLFWHTGGAFGLFGRGAEVGWPGSQ
jgi:D-cysteine desulfhydrase